MPIYPNSAPSIDLSAKLGQIPSFLDWNGVQGDGVHDDSVGISNALAAIGTLGGGLLTIPRGNFLVSGPLTVPAGVHLRGSGITSRIFLAGSVTAGKAILNITGNNVTFESLFLDPQVMTSVPILYSAFSDPLDNSLTGSSGIWIAPVGGATIHGVTFKNCRISHTGGYATILDARAGNIDNVLFESCWYINNRPNIFGISSGDINYGGWNGGVILYSDGVNYAISNIKALGCHWSRVMGHGFWMHSPALTLPNRQVLVMGCSFEDMGLDGTQFANVVGGGVQNCNFHRWGYVTTSDSSTPAPKALSSHGPVGADSAGYVSGCDYSGNTFLNGVYECIDLDGFRDGSVQNNTGTISQPGDPSYTPDSVSSYPFGTRGMGASNSNRNGGGENIDFANNDWYGMGESAENLMIRFCTHRGGKIVHPATVVILSGTVNTANPIVMLSASGTDETLNHDNTLEGGSIDYAGANFCIIEEGTGWTSATANHYFNNRCTGANLGEVLVAAGSGSTVGVAISTNSSSATSQSQVIIQREGFGPSAATKFYTNLAGVGNQIVQINDVGPIFNVSSAGAANTGALTTGNITSAGILHCVATQRIFSEGGYLSLHDTGTFDSSGDGLDIASQSPSAWGLIRYNKSSGIFEASVATNSSAHRIWTALVPSGSAAVPGGTDTMVQYNKATVFAGDANLTWDYTNQIFTVTTKPVAGAGMVFTDGVGSGGGIAYMYSNGGFYTPANSATAIHVPAGTVSTLNLTATGTQYNSIQCSNATGGVSAYSVIATGFMQIGLSSGPPTFPAGGLSGPAAGAVYWDTSVPGPRIYNGSAWIAFGTTGGSVAGSDTFVQYNNHAAFAADLNFKWNYDTSTGQILTITARAAGYAALVVTDGVGGGGGLAYIQSNGGFLTPSTAAASIQTAGGVTAATAVITKAAGNAIQCTGAGGGFQVVVGTITSPLSNALQLTTGGLTVALSAQVDNAFYSKNQSTIPVYSPTSGYSGIANKSGSIWWIHNGATWVAIDLQGGSVAGSNTQVQWNNSGVFGASANYTFDNTNHRVFIGTAALPATPQFFTATRLCLYDNANGASQLQFISDHNSASGNAQLDLEAYSSTGPVLGGLISGLAARGTLAAPSATQSGDTLVQLRGGGFTSALVQSQASIKMVAGSNWSSGNAETYMSFMVTTASSTSAAEAMRIASNGVLLVGRTTGDGTGALVMINGAVSGTAGIFSAAAGTAVQCTGSGGGFTGAVGTFTNGNYNSVQCTNGGMAARNFSATVYLKAGQSNGGPGSGGSAFALTTGDTLIAGLLYWDTGLSALRVYNGSAYVSLATGTVAAVGPAGEVQYSAGSGVFAASANLTFTGTLLTVAGSPGVAVINATGGYMQSDQGFLTAYSGATALHASTGGCTTATGYYVGATQVINSSAQFNGSAVYIGAAVAIDSSRNVYCNQLLNTGAGVWINSSGQFVGAGINMTSGCNASGYSAGGSPGLTTTRVAGGVSFGFKGGILVT